MAAWTPGENKLFEECIADLDHESPDFFENIRKLVPNKTVQDIQHHYQELERDLQMIESGYHDHIILPPMIYVDPNIPIMDQQVEIKEKSHGLWNADEHGEFLRGLEKHGRGDWIAIARDFVPGRTSTQVATHAQKYFIKINKQEMKKQQQKEEEMQYQQQQGCSSSNAQNAYVVLDRNKTETSGDPVDAIMVTPPHDASGPGVSDIAHHQH